MTNPILEVFHGDITDLEVDAMVNAANETLLGGAGVDGTIHAAAGPELLKECKTLGGCERGEAKITGGYNSKAKNIIHTVGPKYGQENGDEDEIFSSCYRNSLSLAQQAEAKTIAFPNISTGIYRYPKDEAAEIAVNTTLEYIKDHSEAGFEKIIFVSFTKQDYKIFKKIFDDIIKSKPM